MNKCFRLRMSILSIVILFVVLLSSFDVESVKPKTDIAKKPNIIIITADDLGWADIVGNGADLHETPNLDKLEAQGLKFTNAYAAAAVCTPTRASLMTGKYPARLHMTIWSEWATNPQFDQKLLPPDVVGNLPHKEKTLAEVLKDAGYLTAHVGKWHLGESAYSPEFHGFDVNIGGNHWGCPPTFFYPYRGNIYDTERFVPGLESNSNGNYFSSRKGEYLTDRLTDEAIKIMDGAKNNPFFLNLSYYSVHTPIEGKPETVKYFKNKIKSNMNHQNAIYAAMVNSLDENIGRVMDKIDELGISENTILIFISDNGGLTAQWDNQVVTNNSPLRSGKGSLYEGGIKIPMLIRYPGVTIQRSVTSNIVSTIDILPTITEILNIKDSDIKIKPDGKSLLPIMKNPKADMNREFVFWHYPHYYYPITSPVSSVRNRDWKLLQYYEDNHVELYNLKEDPSEKNNLSKKMQKKTKELLNALNSWKHDVNAQVPTINTKFK